MARVVEFYVLPNRKPKPKWSAIEDRGKVIESKKVILSISA
jgi:hypothetical protein